MLTERAVNMAVPLRRTKFLAAFCAPYFLVIAGHFSRLILYYSFLAITEGANGTWRAIGYTMLILCALFAC